MWYKVTVLCIIGVLRTYPVSGEQNTTATDQSFRSECTKDDPPWSCRKKLIEGLFAQYDNRLAPTTAEGGPTNVTVQIYITSIDTISETNMDFSLSMFLRQSWVDSRLTYTPIEGMRSLELDATSMSKVWIPDLFIPAEKRALVHDVTVPNKLMHVYHDGKIQYSLRISATIKCNFDLRKFPMDSQHCFVEMESYGYTTDTLRFKWDEKSISKYDGMQIPQFYLNDLTTEQCDKTYYGVGYSCVRFDFYMQRSMGYYITQVFIPSYLIVFLSWVSFWLDIDAVPARISLGLLTVLTMTTQSAGARNNLPKVSYLKAGDHATPFACAIANPSQTMERKEDVGCMYPACSRSRALYGFCTVSSTAIDVWMAVCLGFVFLALVQFAYVNVLSRVEKRRKTTTIGTIAVGKMMAGVAAKKLAAGPKKDPETAKDSEHNDTPTEKSKFLRNLKKLNLQNIVNADREKARNVDRVSRVLFPLAFLIFNLVYWFTYVFWEPEPL